MRNLVVAIIVLVALVLGILVGGAAVGVMVLARLARGPDQVVVLISKEKITQWTTIREPRELFDIRTMPRAAAPEHFIPADEIDRLVGRRLKATIAPGSCLTEDELLKKDIPGLESVITPGKRAMSIKISADRAVGFFVVPGCRVDVVQTHDGVSKVLLEDVLVLAIDLNVAVPEDRVGIMGGTATLQVDTDQALKLTAAQEKGTLSLLMRPVGDDAEAKPKKDR